MSLPPLIREAEQTQAEWNRKARDAVNRTIVRLMGYGTTVQRPVNPTGRVMYFDDDLGKPIWWNGSGWVDAAGASV